MFHSQMKQIEKEGEFVRLIKTRSQTNIHTEMNQLKPLFLQQSRVISLSTWTKIFFIFLIEWHLRRSSTFLHTQVVNAIFQLQRNFVTTFFSTDCKHFLPFCKNTFYLTLDPLSFRNHLQKLIVSASHCQQGYINLIVSQ